MEIIIPIEIGVPTLLTETPNKVNTKDIAKDLDMADKLREAGTIRLASYQQRTKKLYNKHLKSCTFRAGDLVLRRVFENTAPNNQQVPTELGKSINDS